MFKREGFWQGSDLNPEAIVHVESEPRIEGFAQHTFESSSDLLENHDPEMLPLLAEQYPLESVGNTCKNGTFFGTLP